MSARQERRGLEFPESRQEKDPHHPPNGKYFLAVLSPGIHFDWFSHVIKIVNVPIIATNVKRNLR